MMIARYMVKEIMGRLTISIEELRKMGYDENGNRIANKTSNMEQLVGNESMAKKKDTRFDTPVRITIHSVRKQLADPDGISGKAAIDGLVKAGILGDDTSEEVKEVRFTQEKGQDKTIITITPVKRKG